MNFSLNFNAMYSFYIILSLKKICIAVNMAAYIRYIKFEESVAIKLSFTGIIDWMDVIFRIEIEISITQFVEYFAY